MKPKPEDFLADVAVNAAMIGICVGDDPRGAAKMNTVSLIAQAAAELAKREAAGLDWGEGDLNWDDTCAQIADDIIAARLPPDSWKHYMDRILSQ